MRVKHCVFGLGLVLASTVPSEPVFAQAPAAGSSAEYPSCVGKQVSPEESEAAHKKYTAGKVDYDEANYDAAIARFRDSYAKDCSKHEILVIISRAYEQKGDRAEAVRALETYLQRVPSSPERSTYESRIAKLKELMEKDRQKAATAALVAGPQSNGEKAGGHTVSPWILVGVGGAAIVVGAIVLVAAPPLPDNCNETNGKCIAVNAAGQNVTLPKNPADDTPEQKAQRAELQESQEQAGNHVGMTMGGLITMIAGGGLVAGGLLWHFLEPTGSSTAPNNTKLAPAVAPGYAGLSLGGSF